MNQARNPQTFALRSLVWAHLTRALVLSLSLGLLAFPLAGSDVVLVTVVIAVFGNMLGILIARTQLRAVAVLIVAVGAALLGYGLISEVEKISGGDPTQIFAWTEYATFGVAAFLVSFVFRFSAMRWRPASLLEALVPVLAVVQLLIAHRDGAINRPYALSDPLLAMGWDPVPVFMGVGAAACLVMLWILLRSTSITRTVFHLAAIVAFLLFIVTLVQQFGLPSVPEQPWTAGLRPDEKDGNSKGKGSSRPPSQRTAAPDFSSGNNESGSNAPVAVVVFHDDYQPSYGVYYFRQGAYSQFNGHRLVSATTGNVDTDLINPFTSKKLVKIAQGPAEAPYRQSVTTDVALISDHYQPFGLESPVSSREENNPNPNRFRQFYEVTSNALVADGSMLIGHHAGNPKWSKEIWKHYTESPSDTRYVQLAEEIVTVLPDQLAGDPFAEALVISQWLGEKGTYSFKNAHENAEDPTSSFLFGDLTGYCVHFAHAAVYLMRSLGLPARVANGYAVDSSFRRGGSSLLISGSYAHAWPELYLDDVGWVIVDVSPKRSLVPPPEPMDQELQQLMGEIARGNTGKEEDKQQWSNYLVTARKVSLQYGLILMWTMCIVLLGLFMIKLWRAWFPWFAPATILPTVVYRSSLDRLSDVSLQRAWGESREAFAQRLSTQTPAFDHVTQAHIASAFARDSSRVDRRALLKDARQFRSQLRATQPWWKRFLGALLPWSWIRSR